MAAPAERIKDPSSYESLVWVPEPTDDDRPVPVLLYLHGAGEVGTDLGQLLNEGATGTPPWLCANGSPGPLKDFVVLAPQTQASWEPDVVARFVDFVLGRPADFFPAMDRRRAYVTGHSMGGAGALGAATTGKFAAVVPVAPAGAVRPHLLVGVPVWAFHGANDQVVPSSFSERLIRGLRSAGATPDHAKLTLYDNAPTPPGWPRSIGHASTIPAYATPELYVWLLSHHLSSSPRPPRHNHHHHHHNNNPPPGGRRAS